MLAKFKKDQSGAASLIVVMLIVIILSVMTLGFLRTALFESEGSFDSDLSRRAFYAAESGLEDAKRAIKENLENPLFNFNGDICASAYGDQVISPEYDVEYVCQLIDLEPEEVVFDNGAPNTPRQAILNAVDSDGNPAGYDTIIIEWHREADVVDDGDGTPVSFPPANGEFSTAATWRPATGVYPAVMKVEIIEHPTGSFTPDQVESTSYLLRPASGGVTSFSHLSDGSNSRTPIEVDCTPSYGEYACRIEIGVSGANQRFLRLTNLYYQAKFEIGLANGAEVRRITGNQAVVDVTGRAADVYRRIRTTLDISGSDPYLPSFTVTSAQDICKSFSAGLAEADFVGSSGTSCN